MTQARKATGSAGKGPSARQRARAVLAAPQAARRERERKIEDALTASFDRLSAVHELQLAVAAADRDLAAAVAVLGELGERPESIAAALEVPRAEVQRLLKLAEEAPAGEHAGRPAADRLDSVGAVPEAVAG